MWYLHTHFTQTFTSRRAEVLVLQIQIHDASDFYINVKGKLVGILWNCKKSSREWNHLKVRRKLVGILWHLLCHIKCYRYIFDIYCEYMHNCYIAIASPLSCTWTNEGFSKTIICVQNRLLRLLIFALTFNLLLFVING